MKVEDIITNFGKILINKIKEIDVRKNNVGRKNKFELVFYVENILKILFTGISWANLSLFIYEKKITVDAIRKKFNKWVSMGIFNLVHIELIELYKAHYNNKLKYLLLDAMVVKNISGDKHITGFCNKIKNKRSTKYTLICDINKIGVAVNISESSKHDSTHIETTINNIPTNISELYSYKSPVIITADLGYIINNKRRMNIRKDLHATINTNVRINMKRKNKTKTNKALLNKRIYVEHFNSLFSRQFKKFSTITYRNMNSLEAFLRLLLVFKFIYFYFHFHV